MVNEYSEHLASPQYGSVDAIHHTYGSDIVKGQFTRQQRRRLNWIAIAMALFIPCGVFGAVFMALSFSLHYHNPFMSYFICFLAALVVIYLGYMAASHTRKKARADPTAEPAWYVFIFVTSLVGWILGMLLGNMNYNHNMLPFYDVGNLNTYPSIDPSRMRGQQLMDAGRVIFAEGAHLDLEKSMGFRNSKTYCVAPISIGEAPLATYDFWAVGVDCCSSNTADYHCGEFNNPTASAGLRLMSDSQRAYFRLAVQQAEAAYDIQAVHPLFFWWMQDPVAELQAYEDDGGKMALLGSLTFFAVQLFLVVAATIAFSKMGYW